MVGDELALKPTDGSLEVLAPEARWHRQFILNRSIQTANRIGIAIVAAFMAVFTLWGVLVPLAAGAIAPGALAPVQGKKVVQHLEDGIIAELRVHDGDVVEAGQPLVVLEDVQARANHDALQQQLWSLLAKQARLQTESGARDSIAWPLELPLAEPKTAAIINAQQLVFETRAVELS